MSTGGQQQSFAAFHASIDDALGACVEALRGPKKVAEWLHPALPAHTGEARVRASLNPEREQKFSPGEVELIGRRAREVGCFALQEYLAASWACEFKPLAPVEAKKRARRVRRLALLDELRRLDEDDQ